MTGQILIYVLLAVLGYLIGSISMSIILTRYIYKDDVRDHGSGNAGATNVARVFGWWPGILTFLCDFAKCVLAFWVGKKLGGYAGGAWGAEFGSALAEITCLLGHCFPVYFGFRGGKAVSTGACVAFLIDWRLFVIILAVFILVFLWKRIVSISSICAAGAMILASPFLAGSRAEAALGIFAGLLVIFMHRDNIRRLKNGTESKFKAGSRK